MRKAAIVVIPPSVAIGNAFVATFVKGDVGSVRAAVDAVRQPFSVNLLAQAAAGEMTATPTFADEAFVTVVCAAERYPSSPRTGDVIEGIEAAEATGATVFCAGVSADDDGRLVTAGGRVLAVTGSGATLAAARDAAYAAVDLISWPGMQRRTDIARRAAGQE